MFILFGCLQWLARNGKTKKGVLSFTVVYVEERNISGIVTPSAAFQVLHVDFASPLLHV